jgi:uncharacterized protein YkwD
VRIRKVCTIGTISAAFALLSLQIPPASAAETCWRLHNTETALKRETNESRHNHGRARLPLDQDLSKVARIHSRKMADAGYAFHTPGSRFGTLLRGSWSEVHENVGMAEALNADPTRDIARLEREFMNSPTHRQNILTKGSRYIGVGIVRAGGFYYVTVLFVEGGDPGTSVRLPTC